MQRVIVDVRDLGCNLDMAWARRRAISLSLSLSLSLSFCPRLCFFFSLPVLYFVTVFGGYGVLVWVFGVCFGFGFLVVMVFLSLMA